MVVTAKSKLIRAVYSNLKGLLTGWKGTLMGVAVATVDAMVADFGCRASDIVVAVGPTVGVCCFTLDREQALNFASIHPDCVPDPELARPHVDIRLASRYTAQGKKTPYAMQSCEKESTPSYSFHIIQSLTGPNIS